MFCGHCGKENGDHQKFCGFCGRPLNYDSVQNSYYDFNPTDFNTRDIGLSRQKELEKIDDLISFFAVEQRSFDEYDSEAQKINELNRMNAKGLLMWSIIVQVIAFIGAAQGATGYNYEPAFAFIYLLFGSSISGVLLIIFFSLNRRRKVRLEDAIKKYCCWWQYLSDYYYIYEDCPIGLEYSNPSNLNAVRGMIASGRAYSIKEALNILTEVALRNRKKDLPYMAAKYLISARKICPDIAVVRGSNFFDSMY